MKKFVYIFIFALISIMQLSVVPVIFHGRVLVNLMLMSILAWSLLDGFSNFLPWAISMGIIFDLFSYSSIGLHALIFLLVAYSVSFLSKRFDIELKGSGLIMFLLFVAGSTILSNAIIAADLARQVGLNEFWQAFGNFGQVFLQIFYNALAFVFWFWLIKNVKEFFQLEN